MRYLSIFITLLSLIYGSAGLCTVVAFDGTHLACDSQLTHGHRKLMCKGKFYRSDARHAVMAAGGEVDILEKIEAFWNKSDKPLSDMKIPDANPASLSSRFQLLIVQDDGQALFYDDDLSSPIHVEAPFAFGTGGDFALAAMHMGADAADAVAVAEDLDIYCSGTIHVIRAPQTAVEAPAAKK
jgi:ATP-dependent protease HslVU (ClpYQ) peptidase subunit